MRKSARKHPTFCGRCINASPTSPFGVFATCARRCGHWETHRIYASLIFFRKLRRTIWHQRCTEMTTYAGSIWSCSIFTSCSVSWGSSCSQIFRTATTKTRQNLWAKFSDASMNTINFGNIATSNWLESA